MHTQPSFNASPRAQSRTLRGIIAGLVVAATAATAAVWPATRAGAVDMVDVTVTIIRYQVHEQSDPAPGQGDSDVYARVRIGSNPTQNNESDQIEALSASPHWTFTNQVDRDAFPSTTVTIQLADDDTGIAAPDDELDIDPEDNNLDLVLTVDLFNATWSGDVAPNVGFSRGDNDTEHSGLFEGGEDVSIWFDISIGSDGDIDDDGIPDGVERFGIRDGNGNVIADMAALGADPCRKTIAIEIDWLEVTGVHSHQPNPAALTEAAAMMNNAPFPAAAPCPYAGFPEQASGIDLITDVNQAIPMSGPTEDDNFGIAQLDARRATNFHPDRTPYFFYNIWAHEHDGTGSSGVCCSAQKGFMVTLGSWTGGNGTVRDQSGTFLHELGHNIGLPHGGSDGVNFKPNYLSIMNYRYQVIGIPNWATWGAAGFAGAQLVASSTIDYSRSALAPIDETSLAEASGIGGGGFAAFWTDPGLTLRAGNATGGLDWNWSNNGNPPFQGGVNQDLNGDSVCVTAGMDGTLDTTPAGDDIVLAGAVVTGPDRTCNTARVGDDSQDRAVGFVQPAVFNGWDDWSNIKFLGAMSPDAGFGGHDEDDEMTFAESERIKFEMEHAANEPPVADAGGPYAVDEGSDVQLDGTASSDPDGDTLTYSWTPVAHLDNPSSATPIYDGVDDTVDLLTLTVTDPGGLSDSDTTTVTVNNVAPTVTATGDTIDEGGTADVTATFTDPGVLDTHTATIDWGDGLPAESVPIVQGAGLGSLQASHPYGDNGSYTVTVTLTDDDSGVGSDAATVTVANVDPVVDLNTDDKVVFPGGEAFVGRVNVPQTHDVTATDAGSDDLTVDWSFGTSTTYYNDGVGPDPFPSPLGTYPFTVDDTAEVVFTIPGVETIGVTVTDDDGGTADESLDKVITGDAERDFGNGYWKHQYTGNGQPQVDPAWLDGYLEIVAFVSGVFVEDVPLASPADAADVLSPSGSDKREVATADLLAAWLHFASGAVAWDAAVPTGGRTSAPFLDVMTEIESIVADPASTRADLQHASFLAQRVRQAG